MKRARDEHKFGFVSHDKLLPVRLTAHGS